MVIFAFCAKTEEITQRLNDVYEKIEDQPTPESPTEPSVERMRELTRNDTW